jgi:error-prone DNA polymerase
MRLAEIHLRRMLENTLAVAGRCNFDPEVIRENYKYPLETLGSDETPAQTLVRKTWEGARGRYPEGIPDKVRAQVQKELDIIIDLKYEMFFLTVENIGQLRCLLLPRHHGDRSDERASAVRALPEPGAP